MNPHQMPYLTVTATKPDDGAATLTVRLDIEAFLRHRDGRSLARKALERSGVPFDSSAVDAAIEAVRTEPPRPRPRKAKPAE